MIISKDNLSIDDSGPTYGKYLQLAPENTFSPLATEPRLETFVALFSNLDTPSINKFLDQTYPETLYFNDTFHYFSDRQKLKKYFLDLAEIAETEVTVLDVSSQGDNVLLRWKMNTKSKVLWKTLDIESIGITHLRFNESGKIVMHQDYWDSAAGFYEHIPFVGAPIRAIRSRMAD